MVKVSTALVAKKSPRHTGKEIRNKFSLFKSVFKAPHSPINARAQNSPFRLKQGKVHTTPRNPPGSISVLKENKGGLHTIREESPEPDVPVSGKNRHACASSGNVSFFCRDLESSQNSDGAGEESSSEIDSSDFEGWDDETTLVAKFQGNGSEASEREKLSLLAHELEAPMHARGEFLKQYLVYTIAPAARKVKEVHSALEQKVDVAFGVGVLSFDDACKKIERKSLRDEEDLATMRAGAQRKIDESLKQLKEAYEYRMKLLNDLQDAVDKCASKTIASLSSFPAELEASIATVEKKAKEVTKGSGLDGISKQKLLRELLAKM